MDAKIAFIYNNTIYDEATAKEKLELFNGDEMAVVRDYLSSKAMPKSKPATTSKPRRSLNQEIYRQFREKLTISAHFT